MSKGRKLFGVLDCETDPFQRGRIPQPFVWGFYDGTNYETFADLALIPEQQKNTTLSIDSLPEFLFDREIIVYAHNGGKFDFHYLIPYFNEWQTVTVINGRIAKVKLGLCELRDSYTILSVPLSAYQKNKISYDIFESDERYKKHNYKKITDYLYSDCLYLYQLIEAFQDRNGRHLTQAGSSLSAWRKIDSIGVPSSTSAFYEKFSVYYYGGRTEVFMSGIINEDMIGIDINSAYPFAMLSEHPYSLEYEQWDGWDDLDGDIGPMLFHILGISSGALPYRSAETGDLFFPDDNLEREYRVTGWEIKAGLETDTLKITKLITVYDFDVTTNFRKYILPMYAERKAAEAINDKATSLLVKLGMNSLYGKFASNPSKYNEYLIIDPENSCILDMEKNDELFRGRELRDLVGWTFAGRLGPWVLGQRALPEEKRHYYNVVTSASITGYVRAYLWRVICRCDGVAYCDTDSITARNIGGAVIGPELGEWEIEGEYVRLAIAGKKMYAFQYKNKTEGAEYKTAHKGVKLTANQIISLCEGVKVKYIPKNPTYSIMHAPCHVSRDVVFNAKTAKKDLVGKK